MLHKLNRVFGFTPSPAAAHWVHSHYAQSGGKFVDKESQVDPRLRDYVQERMDAQMAAKRKKLLNQLELILLAENVYEGNKQTMLLFVKSNKRGAK